MLTKLNRAVLGIICLASALSAQSGYANLSGRVTDSAITDPDTSALRDFDAVVLGDPRFTATILPVGAGLLIAGLRG